MTVKIRKRIFIALLVSIMLHIGFLVWSYFVRLLPPIPFPEKLESVFHVKIVKQELMGEEKVKFDTQTTHPSPRTYNDFTDLITSKPSVESEELIKNNIEASMKVNKQSLIPSSVQENQVIRKSELNDILVTKKVRRSPRENLAELGEVPHEDFASGSPVLNSGEDISRHFLDKSAIPSNASMAAPLQSANTQNEFQVMKRSPSGVEHVSQAMDLGTALTYQLFKYKDPATGQKYFKLSVKVRDATMNFPVVPKEIIFLLDASGSIGMKRLTQFEDGLVYSLKHLNPEDRFNIFVFKDKTIPFSPLSLKAGGENIKKAIDFLRGLRSWSTTDIYGALRASLDLNNPFVPSYRVIMTDGFPTKGILDDRHVINEISKINDNRVSFFTFGGGSFDPYMLDFIAFKNRGWSRYTDRDYFISRELSRLYDEIKDPLLLNVRYYVSGLNDKEIFPRVMPDFFKGSQFVVYGKYTNENRFILQVRGDTATEKKEFLVTASLQEATVGDRQIARDWAFHKVYYLISQLKFNENNEALIDAIDDLCSKFQIITPYSSNFRKAPQKSPVVKSTQAAPQHKVINPITKK
jgi:hypothetical protein